MRILERNEIDVHRWDNLAKEDIFSQSRYLDAVAENWCVLIKGDYQGGLAIPYTIRLGIRTAYIPVFSRQTSCFEMDLSTETRKLIQDKFVLGELVIGKKIFVGKEHKQYQFISTDSDWIINSQAKRMVRKFEKSTMRIEEMTTAPKQLFRMIQTDLQGKAQGVHRDHIERLEQLTFAFEKSGDLAVSVVRSERGIEGGVLFLKNNEEVIYLKSAFTPHAKKNGAMYACMYNRIQQVRASGRSFDFGGSAIAGVRTFNHNLGGSDCFLERLKWDNSPWWFRLAKSLKR